MDNEANSIDVGKQLRLLRDERGISMRLLAKMSGLSANALSMIERGLTSPSVSTLNKIALALEVPITAFFRQESAKEKIVFRKASERPRVPFLRGLWEGLGSETFEGCMETFLLTLDAGGSSGQHMLIHTGYEFVFCLRGKLEYEVDRQQFTLEAGDSLLFFAHLPHRWRNMSHTVVNALVVISSFDERDHPGQFHRTTPGENSPENVVESFLDEELS